MIKVDNLFLGYEGNSVVEDISFNVKKGDFTTILGRNGSGKSTLIKAISGNIKSDSGKVVIYNDVVNKASKKKLSKKMAYMFQFNDKIENMTVYDFVSFGRTPFKNIFHPLNKKDIQVIDKSLEQTSLSEYKNRKMDSLSGGEKQRVYLAMCLAQEPEILILDEPTNHLDVKFQYELLTLIRKINIKTRMTVLCVLHDLNQAIKYSDELIFIKDKKLFMQGSPDTCVNEKLIEDVFDVETKVHRTEEGIHVDYIVEDCYCVAVNNNRIK